jgi:cyclopropane fatty-acyl-phospholipid synthase-like methyltransferase
MAFTAVDAYDRLIGATRRRSPSACSTLRGVWPGQRVLDLGCGPGATAALAAPVGATNAVVTRRSRPGRPEIPSGQDDRQSRVA